MVIHAASKAGKSTLTSTAPSPILVLDAEGSWRFIRQRGFKSDIPLRVVQWKNTATPPPVYDGTWDVCHTPIRVWKDLTNIYAWITQRPHSFKSVIFDSVTECQRKLKKNLFGTDQMRIQDWGTLLTMMDNLIRDFRDIVEIPGSPLQVVIFNAETRVNQRGIYAPFMQGQIADALPYWVDVCGYLFPDYVTDANGQATQRIQKLLIGPHPQYLTGERVQGLLPDVIINPNITDMFNAVYNDHDHSIYPQTAPMENAPPLVIPTPTIESTTD